ncbi:phospholipase D-like domain-containing protein [Dokdonella sp.]|uniref:phospholipase D-like domain-containing protein n=1 Tax=Dokdonella sp. TaxID=2291710 RepID=UPI001B182CCC|nr:phospholipase D-like domain-containing protein [Dokdonella sp.]MBO9662991.1 cardiolipin synthase B [Dokdonella sp.]
MSAAPPSPHTKPSSLRLLAEQAFSRAAGAPLVDGNAVELMIDMRATFDAWLAAIRAARNTVLFENYIFRDDEIGRAFRDALVERVRAGVRVFVLRDWMGCLGQSRKSFWKPLLDAGGEVRVYNPPRFASPFGWLSRDHRKLLVVDGEVGFLGGVCVSAKWLGDPARGIDPWRDTAVAVRGPAVADLARAFAESWAQLGTALPDETVARSTLCLPAGTVDLRVVATVPNTAGLYRLDQLIAGMARTNLWLTDAYFVGVAPYVQALVAAARDGVDVRLLVPGSSDVPAVAALSRAGYRPLLEAGVRVFEWKGSMLHAKTAVADSRWARVGSSNLNVASWIGNCEIDVAVEDEAFARRMEAQYLADLGNSTEIVLKMPRSARKAAESADPPRGSRKAAEPADLPRGSQGGSTARAAAGALRLANTVGAAIANRRTLGRAESGPLLFAAALLLGAAAIAVVWPRAIAWPLAALGIWLGASLVAQYAAMRRKKR